MWLGPKQDAGSPKRCEWSLARDQMTSQAVRARRKIPAAGGGMDDASDENGGVATDGDRLGEES